MGKKPQDVERNSPMKYIFKLQNKKGKKIVTNFGCKKIPQGATSKRFYPVFNIGSPSFSPSFICENLRLRKRHRDQSYYMKQLQQRIKRYELKPIDLKEAKPRAKSSGSYCAVCKTHYKDDYFKHIKSKSHKDIIEKDPFQSYLMRLEKYYKRKIEIKEQQASQQAKQTE